MTREQEIALDWEEEKIDDPAHFLLHQGMRGIFEAEEMIEGDCIIIPKWELTIRPHVAKWTDQTVMLQFQVSSPKWDRDIFETTAGIGSNLKKCIRYRNRRLCLLPHGRNRLHGAGQKS